jgi:hypothetical protein
MVSVFLNQKGAIGLLWMPLADSISQSPQRVATLNQAFSGPILLASRIFFRFGFIRHELTELQAHL